MKNDDTKNDDTKPGGLVLTRRGFAATGLVTGFALAAGPLRAEVIHTPDTGLDAGEVTVPVSAGKIPAYRAKPAGKTNLPIVLVVQEVFGVHEHIKDICRRFARLGYYAIAPSLYARYGDPGQYGMDNLHDLFVNIVAKVPDSEVMGDCDATLDFAAGDGADLSRLGVTGFCWGGRIVWLTAAHNPKIKAGVAFYGQLRGPDPVSPLRPHYPLDLAAQIKAPVLGYYGGLDRGIPAADVEAMRTALAKAGNTDSKIVVFKDAGHGFFADYRESYNEADAKTAWAGMQTWFKDHGVA